MLARISATIAGLAFGPLGRGFCDTRSPPFRALSLECGAESTCYDENNVALVQILVSRIASFSEQASA